MRNHRKLGMYVAIAAGIQGQAAQAGTQIEGVLREKGTRAPLANIGVYLVPSTGGTSQRIKVFTDAQGKFTVEDAPEGSFRWIVNFSGYEKLEQEDAASPADAPRTRYLYLERTSYQIYETTITGKKDRRDDTLKSLKASEFAKLPGSGGDPIKAVQNLPGVNRPNPVQSQVIIQGSAPKDTRYTVNGHEVPLIFHFGGLSSVVLPEALDRVDYLSAGYGPEYGRALGGLVGVVSRAPKTDRFHGFAFLDVFNAGAMVEGPVGQKSSFLVGARRSYIGSVLGLVAKNNADFNLTVAPNFSDITTVYETELTPIDQLRLIGVASRDELKFVLSRPVGGSPSFRGNFNNMTSFFRLIPEVTHRHSARTLSRWSIGLGKDWTRVDFGDNFSRNTGYSVSSRAEIEKKANELWTTIFGLDHRFLWSDVEFSLPGSFRGVSEEEDRKTENLRSNQQQLGFYWRNNIKLPDSNLLLMPSVRADYFSLTQEWIPAVKVASRYGISESLAFRNAGGLYAQPPLEQEVDPVLGNPDLKSPRAWHLSAGFEKDFRQGSSQGWVWTTGTFYRYFDQLVIRSSDTVERGGNTVAEIYDNDGRGRAYGAESLLKMDFKPWMGWLSYTLSRSTRFDPETAEYVFAYDQTHLLTAVAGFELKGNWTISTRFRYATGNPLTPVTDSIFDSDRDRYVPIRGPLFSTRLEPFMQLDLRFDKKWIFDDWILSAYLDVQNVTNRANIESVGYAYDYQSQTNVTGLPILPTFGLKGEF